MKNHQLDHLLTPLHSLEVSEENKDGIHPSQNNTIQIYLLLENSPEITTLVTNQVYLPVAGVERPGTVVATEEEKEDDNQN